MIDKKAKMINIDPPKEQWMEQKKNSLEWRQYIELMEERPEVFQQNDLLKIVTDLEKIYEYERANRVLIGVIYKSKFNYLVVDLIQAPNGKLFAYERMLPAVVRGAVVCMTRCQGKYILLKQFRHSIRDYQYAFVRGFGEEGLTSAENACKELEEEISAKLITQTYLGQVIADSGLHGNLVDVYCCDIESYDTNSGYEGIEEVLALTEEELKAYINEGKITDGYTLAALSLLQSK